MSINRGMDEEDVVPIYNGILLSHEKELNNAIYSNMDGLRVPGICKLQIVPSMGSW